MAYVNKKAKLFTPEGVSPSYNIFPITVLDGIYDGLNNAGNAAYKIIYTDSTSPQYNKIKEKYLSIMGSTTTVVDGTTTTSFYVKPNYLQMLASEEVTVGGNTYTTWHIQHSYLDILDNDKIDPKYLPSYVDDVVEVVVFTGENWPTIGTVGIRESVNEAGVTVYKFYTKVGNSWQAGGGESSKIYMDVAQNDSAIFRCAPNDQYTAYRIDSNPYVIDGATTNGVYLEQNGSTLRAKALQASSDHHGTVQITEATVNGVYMSVTNGVLSVGGIRSNGLEPGTVVTVGSTASIDTFKANGYVTANIVPNAEFMIDYVDSAVKGIRPVVNKASYEDYGIVRISQTGGILVDDGIISVPLAGATVAGRVAITGTSTSISNSESTVNGLPLTVTPKAVHDYVDLTLVGHYQPTLTPGPGISIVSNVVSAKVKAPLLIDPADDFITVPTATDTTPGVVCITDKGSDIVDGSAQTTDGNPLTVTPNAVYDFVGGQITGATNAIKTAINEGTLHGPQITTSAAFDVADNANKLATVAAIKEYVGGKQGVQSIAEGVGIKITGTGDATIAVRYGGAITTSAVTGGTAIVVPDAAANVKGAVTIKPISTATPADKNGVPTAYDVQSYIDSELGYYQIAVSAGVGLSKTMVHPTGAGSDYERLDVIYTSPLTTVATESGTAITVLAATKEDLGVVQVGDGIAVNAGLISLSSAGLVDTVTGATGTVIDDVTGQLKQVYIPLGGVRIWSSGGIQASNGVLALKSATSTMYGGVKVHSSNAVVLDGTGRLKLLTTAPLTVSNSSLQIDYATDTTSGAVVLIKGATAVDNINNDTYVPTGAAVSAYVDHAIATVGGATYTAGPGIKIDEPARTIEVLYTGALTKAVVAGGTALSVLLATTDRAGVIQVGSGLGIANTSKVYVKTAAYVDEIDGTTATYVDGYGNTTHPTVEVGGVRIWSSGGIHLANGVLSLKSAGFVDTIDGTTCTIVDEVHGTTAYVDVPVGGVRVWKSGGINISNGVISLDSATNTTYGGIKVSDTHALTLDENGILALNATAPLEISNKSLRINNATDTTSGVVTLIKGSTAVATINDDTKVPTGSAVKAYVEDKIATMQPPLQESTGIKIAATTVAGQVYDTVSVRYGGAITTSSVVDDVTGTTNNALYVPVAGSTTTGAVQMQALATAKSTDSAYTVPKAYDVVDYVAGQLTPYQKALTDGTGVSTTYYPADAEHNIPESRVLNVLYGGAITTSSIANKNRLIVQSATTDRLGVVQIGNGLGVTNGVVSLTLSSAAYVTASGGSMDEYSTEVPLGGVRVWTSGGIQTVNGVLALKAPTALTFGGVMLHASNGLVLGDNNQLMLNTTLPMSIYSSSLHIAYATAGESGAVRLIKGATAYTAMSSTDEYVPTGSAVVTYVESKIANAAEAKLGKGDGIDITPVYAEDDETKLVSKTISVDWLTPLSCTTENKLTVQTAQGEQVSDLTTTPSARGAVWVRTEIRGATAIASDPNAMRLGTVPTEAAVRSFVDTTVSGLRYLDYDIVED